jgi:hypothetical protein
MKPIKGEIEILSMMRDQILGLSKNKTIYVAEDMSSANVCEIPI